MLPVSRSLVSAVTPWALIRTRLRIVRPIGIKPSVERSGFSSSRPRLKKQPHAQNEEQDIATLDDQGLAP